MFKKQYLSGKSKKDIEEWQKKKDGKRWIEI
jgi:hypothetical protein